MNDFEQYYANIKNFGRGNLSPDGTLSPGPNQPKLTGDKLVQHINNLINEGNLLLEANEALPAPKPIIPKSKPAQPSINEKLSLKEGDTGYSFYKAKENLLSNMSQKKKEQLLQMEATQDCDNDIYQQFILDIIKEEKRISSEK